MKGTTTSGWFFDWSALKMTNCQTLKEILTLKTFSMGFIIYYVLRGWPKTKL